MQFQKPINEAAKQHERKENISVKCASSLKQKLTMEANKLRRSLREYCEWVFMNFDKAREERDSAIAEAIELKKQIDVIKNEQVNSSNKFRSEMEELKRERDLMNAELEIYQNERLKALFEYLKGKTVIIKSPYDGYVQITVTKPKDLLSAMIYSFKIKK